MLGRDYLKSFWNEFEPDRLLNVHPADLPVMTEMLGPLERLATRDLESYLHTKSFGAVETRLHLSLLPAPYAGNLEKADIFILLLNPGFHVSDYYAHYENADWARAERDSLRQDFSHNDFAHIGLNPRFCWSGAYRWWERKLQKLARERAADVHDGDFYAAMQELSNRVAAIELLPYHSQSYGHRSLANKLPSAKAARTYVREVLCPLAKKDEVALIVTRGKKEWEFPDDRCDNVIFYEGGEARAASLSPGSKGGKKMLEMLNRPAR